MGVFRRSRSSTICTAIMNGLAVEVSLGWLSHIEVYAS